MKALQQLLYFSVAFEVLKRSDGVGFDPSQSPAASQARYHSHPLRVSMSKARIGHGFDAQPCAIVRSTYPIYLLSIWPRSTKMSFQSLLATNVTSFLPRLHTPANPCTFSPCFDCMARPSSTPDAFALIHHLNGKNALLYRVHQKMTS